jgi:hypothetical protein
MESTVFMNNSFSGLTNESKLCSIADEKIYFFYGQSKLGIEVH